MFEVNWFLLQLNRAVEFANSIYPQEKALGVVLLDNLIELELHRIANKQFQNDNTYWFKTRKYKTNTRNEVVGTNSKYNSLLKFSKNNKLITDIELESLNIAHQTRNSIYHTGVFNNDKIELALLFYLEFIKNNIQKFANHGLSMAFRNGVPEPGYEYIYFRGNENQKYNALNSRQYFEDSVIAILSQFNFKESIFSTAKKILDKQIHTLECNIKKIKDNLGSYIFILDFYWYLNKQFSSNFRKVVIKDINILFLIYAFLREHQNSLDDIRNLRQRQKEGRKLYENFLQRHNEIYPFWVDTAKLKKRVDNLNGKNEVILFRNIAGIERDIFYILEDSEKALIDLDRFIERIIDYQRGK
ncbi:TPA: hypothetical protein SHQ29_001369 [Legionella pneumophila]|nr:hypothetical protein [Legionella pneumophila]HEH5959007.1 hypothetical protein [Legionella pneumophila]